MIPDAAIAVLTAKQITPARHWTTLWEDEHAHAFMVAHMHRTQMLLSVRDRLAAGLRAGDTRAAFVRDLAPALQRAGWLPPRRGGDVPTRLKRVFEVNRRVARAAGKWQRIQKTKKVLPYLIYENGPSVKHRPDHLSWRGLMLPADDDWWNEHYPPSGWGCKCRVRQVGKAEHDALLQEGTAQTTKPPRSTYEYVFPKSSPRRGEVVRVPKGVDPSWGYNPGAAPWTGALRGSESLAHKLNRHSGKQAATTYIKQVINGDAFHHALRRRQHATPDAAYPLAVADNDIVGVTPDKVHKWELPPASYLALQSLLDKGSIEAAHSNGASVRVGKHGGKWWAAVLRQRRLLLLTDLPDDKDQRTQRIEGISSRAKAGSFK